MNDSPVIQGMPLQNETHCDAGHADRHSLQSKLDIALTRIITSRKYDRSIQISRESDNDSIPFPNRNLACRSRSGSILCDCCYCFKPCELGATGPYIRLVPFSGCSFLTSSAILNSQNSLTRPRANDYSMWLLQADELKGGHLPISDVANTLDLQSLNMTAEGLAWGAIYEAWSNEKYKLRTGPFSYKPKNSRGSATNAWLRAAYAPGLSSARTAAVGIVNMFHFFNLAGPLGVEGVRSTLYTASLLSATIETDYRGATDGTEFGNDKVYNLAAELGNQIVSDPNWQPLVVDIALSSGVMYHRDRDWDGALESRGTVPHALHVTDLRWLDGVGCSFYRSLANFATAGPFKQAMLASSQCHHMRLVLDQIFRYNELADMFSDAWLDRPLNELITAYLFGRERGIEAYGAICANILDIIVNCDRCVSMTSELAQINSMSVLAYVAIPRYSLLAELKLHKVSGARWLPPTPDLADRLKSRPVLHDEAWHLPLYEEGHLSMDSVARAFILRIYGRAERSSIDDTVVDLIREGFPTVTLPIVLSLYRMVSVDWTIKGTWHLVAELWNGLTGESWDHSIAANFYNGLCTCLSSAETDEMRRDVKEFVGLLGFLIERTTLNPYIRTQALSSLYDSAKGTIPLLAT